MTPLSPRRYPNASSWIILILLSFTWGSSFILIKRGLDIYTPYEVGAWRVFSATLFLLPYAIRYLKPIVKQYLIPLFIMGCLGNLFPSFLFPVAQQGISSAVSGVLNALTPLFVVLIGRAFLSQKMNTFDTIGVLLGFVGTFFLLMTGEQTSPYMNHYAWFAVIATICYGVNIHMIRRYSAKLDTRAIASIALLLVSPFALATLIQQGFFAKTFTNGALPIELLYITLLGLFGTAVAFLLFTYLVQNAGALFGSSVTYAMPVVAVLWGLIDGETITPLQYLSILFIWIAIYLINRKKT